MQRHLHKLPTKSVLIFTIIFTLVVVAGFKLHTVYAATGINTQINFQGKLVDSSGVNVADGTKTVVFSIYDVNSGGTALWTETQTVTTTDGIFRVGLGASTPIPSNFNFNWDGLYLGIKVASDSEMTPRVRLTAVPYAFNAQKVAGLTVQDTSGNASTSGTLQIANGKTVTFGDAFSTTLGNSVAFTTSGATTLTLPTTGILATLAGGETLTNKIIGSTGLTFTGATTDITTGTNEDFTLVPNGTGRIALGTTTPVGYLTLDGRTTGKALAIFNQNGGNQAVFTASISGTTAFVIDNSGNVGIGTAVPASTLHINVANGAGDVAAMIQNNAVTNGETASLIFRLTTATGNFGRIQAERVDGANSKLHLASYQNGTLTNTLTIDGYGNVGIGSTSPLGRLNVLGSTTSSQGQALVQINQTGTAEIFTASQAGITKFMINNTGNVGINTTTPGSELYVMYGAANSSASVPVLSLDNPSGGTQESIAFKFAGSQKALFDVDSGGSIKLSSGNNATTYIGYNGVGTPGAVDLVNGKFTIAANGNLTATGTLGGLTGLTLASGTLSIGGGTGTGTQCLLGGATPGWGTCAGGSSQWTTTVNDIYYTTGNVGIGSASPIGLLNIDGRATGKALAILNQNGGNQAAFTASISGVTKFLVDATGNVGIGTTAPASQLHVYNNGAYPSGISNQLKIESLGSGNVDTTSDVRSLTFSVIASGSNNFSSVAAIQGDVWDSLSSGSIGSYAGSSISLRMNAAGNASNAYGYRVIPLLSSSGSVLTAYKGFEARTGTYSSTGTIATAYGFYAEAQKVTGVTTGYGIYTAGANDLNYFAGNVGIGSASPVTALDVVGNARVSGYATASASLSVGYTSVKGGVGNAAFSGFVGIGTTNPTKNLDIYSANSDAWLRLQSGNGGSGALVQLTGSTTGAVPVNWTYGFNRNLTNGQFEIYDEQANADRLVIDNNGNIGIGTTITRGVLNVTGSTTSAQGQALVQFNQTGTADIFTASQAGNTKFVINNSGNIGIGTTAPGVLFSLSGPGVNPGTGVSDFLITGTGNAGAGLVLSATGASGKDWLIFSTTSSAAPGGGALGFWNKTDSSYRMVIDTVGNVGIGTSNPLGLLNVEGRANGKALAILNQTGNQAILAASQSGTSVFTVGNNGHLAVGPTATLDDCGYGSGESVLTCLSETFTDPNKYSEGIIQKLTFNPSSNSSAALYGNDFVLKTQAGNSFNVGGMYGNIMELDHNGSGTLGSAFGAYELIANKSTGTITNAYGTYTDLRNTGGGTVSNAYGVYVTSFFNSSGTVTNNYGVYVNDQSAVGSTDSYNIYSGGSGKNYFGGSVGIGTSNPIGLLNVDGRVMGKALAILNQTGNQAIFTASSSGLTKFIIDNGGNVGIGTTLPGAALELASGKQIYLPDGTAGNPSIAFTNSTNMGFYRQGTNLMSFVANGQNALNVYGNVGGVGRGGLMIGNGSPVSRIQIQDDNNDALSGITFGFSSSTYMQMYKSGSNQLAIMGGNVGIGTTSPLGLFNLEGKVTGKALAVFDQLAAGDQDLFTASQSGIAKFTIGNTGNIVATGTITGLTGLTLASGGINLGATLSDSSHCLVGGATASWGSCGTGTSQWTTSTSDIYYNSGNVGIGTTDMSNGILNIGMSGNHTGINFNASGSSPAIDINSNTGTGIRLYAGPSYTNGPAFQIWDSTSAFKGMYFDAGNATGADIIFRPCPNSCEGNIGVLAIKQNTGFVGIGGGNSMGGNKNPSTTLDVKASTGTGAIALLTGATSYAGLAVNNTGTGDLFTASASGVPQFVVSNSGNVGIGTSAPNFSLEVEGGDIMIGSKANSTQASSQQFTVITQSTPGTYASGGTASIASGSATAIYNGSLYVGTSKSGSAEVYRYNGTAGSWTKVSQSTAGTIKSGGTAAIDAVSSMTIYNGYLYIGTTKASSAEVYRYDGGTNWTQLNITGTAGKFLTTTTIDGVATMVVSGGKMYIGTSKVNAAQVYRYDGGTTWFATNTTAGTLITTTLRDTITAMGTYNNSLYAATSKCCTGVAELYKYTGGTTWVKITATAGTIGSATAVNSINTIGVFEGRMYVALQKTGGGEIARYEDNGSTAANNFTRITAGSGQIATGGTSAIDAVLDMVPYNGKLYIGTQKANSAEIYRYEGDTGLFTKINGGPAGTINGNSGGTTGIDGIAEMISYNGDLYNFTNEPNGSEGYIYTFATDQSYALKFNANTQQAGGEQNNLLNIAQIRFIASPSASTNMGKTEAGQFLFSHGIMTSFGAYDVAEDYPTRDDQIKPGDVVSIDPNERKFVTRSSKAYDTGTIGVYSENPGFRLSQADSTIIDGANAIPVALVGRVPVKVSTENGEIKSGDYLTTSTVPGVAMKATKTGKVIGQAMEPYSDEGVGKITVYVTSSQFTGDKIASLIPGLSVHDSSLNTSGLASDNEDNDSKMILSYLMSQKDSIGQDSISEVNTDRVTAGLSVITPHVIAHEVTADVLSIASGSALTVHLGTDGKVVFGDSESTGISFDNNGNATFAGTVTAKSIKADTIEGLELLIGKITNIRSAMATTSATQTTIVSEAMTASSSAVLSATVVPTITPDAILNSLGVTGIATFSGDFRVKGSGLIEGMLNVVDSFTANDIVINGLATFFDNVVFKKDVTFEGRPTFNKDTAGFAVIKKGDTDVDVIFTKPYDSAPVINANVVADKVDNSDDQKKLDDALLTANTDYVITRRTNKGFSLVLKKTQIMDINFSWTAVSVKDPTTFRSDITPTPVPSGK